MEMPHLTCPRYTPKLSLWTVSHRENDMPAFSDDYWRTAGALLMVTAVLSVVIYRTGKR